MTDLNASYRQPVETEPGGGSSRLHRFFSAKPQKQVVLLVALALLLAIVYLDWVTPPAISFSLAYALPAIGVTWYMGRAAGFTMSVVCPVGEMCADLWGGGPAGHPAIAVWNFLLRSLFLLLAMALLAAFKDLSIGLETLVDERTKAVRQLAAQLSEAEDAERRRLAHDIHDGLGQMLSLLKMNLGALLAQTAEGSASGKRIQEALETVNELIQRARTLTFDLHPPMLDHLGLAATLQHFCQQFQGQSGVEITVDEQGQRLTLPRMAADSLFRSVKELVNNAAKHGPAKEVVVSLHWTPGRLRIITDDDGPGFDAGAVLAATGSKCLGLAGIRERMLLVGGTMRLESSPGNGTRVVLEVPLPPKEIT